MQHAIRYAQEAIALLDAGATEEEVEDWLVRYDLSGSEIEHVLELVDVVLVERRAYREAQERYALLHSSHPLHS